MISFTYYGSKNIKGLRTFLQSIGNNTSIEVKKLTNTIKLLINNICDGYKKKYCWVSVRISLPHTDYEIPRWHYDGNYLPNDTKINTKFITTLKGDGTLYTDSNIKLMEKIEKLFELVDFIKGDKKIKYMKEKRVDRIKLLEYYNKKINKLSTNEGLILIAGRGSYNKTLHSEPNITSSRIFISIIPNSKKYILTLKEKRESSSKM